MAKRTTGESSIHDFVIAKSAATFEAKGHKVYTNPGNEKNHSINDFYPDVIVKKRDGTIVIEEIETEDSVTQNECENQWKPYSELGYQFNLIVPKDSLGLAQRFIRKAQLKVTLQGYTIKGNTITFYDSGGNPLI